MVRGFRRLPLAVAVAMFSVGIVGCQTAPASRAQSDQRPAAMPKARPANPAAPDKRLQPELPKDQPVEELPIEPIPPVLALR